MSHPRSTISLNSNLVTAVFDGRPEAERAAAELRFAGVPDSPLSVIARHDGASGASAMPTRRRFLEGRGHAEGCSCRRRDWRIARHRRSRHSGCWPLGCGGRDRLSAIPGAAAIGAGAGALAVGLLACSPRIASAIEDASYYEERIHAGGIFVSVEAQEAGIGSDQLRDILTRSGGRTAASAGMNTANA